MPYRAVFHAMSKAVSPVPKPSSQDRPASEDDRDLPRYEPPEPRYWHSQEEPETHDPSSGYRHDQQITNESAAPPLPPRRPEHNSVPRIEMHPSDDYLPPPGPPPAYIKDASRSLPTTESHPPSSHQLPVDLSVKKLSIHDSDSKDTSDMKLNEFIPPALAPHLPPRFRSSASSSTNAVPILPKPIAIPSVNTELGSPYMRAYPPCLADHGISQDTFLRFLDRLNRVSAASPPVVILGVGAGIAGLVPEPTTAIVATAIELTCDVTTYALSKGRTELLLSEVNKEIFGPRGLKVQLAKLEAIAKLANIPVLDDKGKLISSDPEKMKKDELGRVPEPIRLLTPLEDIHEVHTLSAQHRRIRALSPWTMPLIFDGLPDVYTVAQEGDLDETSGEQQQQKNGGISAMGKLHQYVSDYQRKEGEKSLIKGRKKALDKVTENRQKAHESHEKKVAELEKEETRLRKKLAKKQQSSSRSKSDEHDLEKRIEKIATKLSVTLPEEHDKEMSKIQKKYERDDKEERGIRKIHYLIVTDKDDVERQTEDVEMNAEHVGELAQQGKLATVEGK